MTQVLTSLPQLIQNKPLSSLSTLGIGGPANLYTEVRQVEEMQSILSYCKKNHLNFLILGKGSNCLFDDRGFNGCVIHNKIDFLENLNGLFKVGAGYSFSRLGTQTAKLSYGGLEFAAGIPASVGGAVFMNAGANGAETKDHLYSVDFVDENGILTTYRKDDILFSYRYSIFQDKKGAIVSASFLLKETEEARSKQIAIINTRQKTQPYGDKSAGCVFRNPEDQPAGKLIDECGLKGFSIGNASVSSLHANFLINQSEATAADFKELIAKVKQTVKEKTGTALECEVRMVPYEL